MTLPNLNSCKAGPRDRFEQCHSQLCWWVYVTTCMHWRNFVPVALQVTPGCFLLEQSLELKLRNDFKDWARTREMGRYTDQNIFPKISFSTLVANKQILSNLLNYRNNKSTVSHFKWVTCSKPNYKFISMKGKHFSDNRFYFLKAQWMTQQMRENEKKSPVYCNMQ